MCGFLTKMNEELKSEIADLKAKLKKCRDYNGVERIKCVLWHIEKGKSAEEIADLLYMHINTIRSYLKDYFNNKKLQHDPRGGSESKLNPEQTVELEQHLEQTTYLKTKEIVKHVKDTYDVDYTIAGMTDWLKDHSFVYKKPATIPGRLCVKKQADFIKEYEELKVNLKENEIIVFMDAVHPEHQSKRVCGWIKKGEIKHLQSTAQQKRMHLIGAIELDAEPDAHEITAMEFKTVDAKSTIEFFSKLQEKYHNKTTINVICDNGRSFKCKELNTYLEKNETIKIKYLPPYSPNLNPIERLWKILRENIQYNQFDANFNDFRDKTIRFFTEKIHSNKDQIYSRISDNFQIFEPNIISMSHVL